jgi:N-acetylglucosamine-6-phosphate deacetylase
MPDGHYQLGGFVVEVKGNRCLSEGKLAGSVLTLDHAVRNVMEIAGWPLADAVRLATRNPAHTLGLCGQKGQIAPGNDADFVVLRPDGTLVKTIIAGIA